MRMLLVILTLVAFVRPASACKAPRDYPTAIPLIGCPREVVVQALCLRCLEGQISYRVFYDERIANKLADDWEAALRKAGWTITRSSPTALYGDKDKHYLSIGVYTGGTDEWKPYTPKLEGTMVFATFHR